MKFRILAGLYFSLALCSVNAADMTLTPTDVVVSADGKEVVAQFDVQWADGLTESLTWHILENVIMTSGTARLPGTSGHAINFVSTCEPDPNTGMCHIEPNWMVQSGISESLALADDRGIDDAQTQGWALPVAGAACAAGWFAARSSLHRTCTRQGEIVDEMSVGICGMGYGSSVSCKESDEDDDPPSDPPGDDDASFPSPFPGEPPCTNGPICDPFWDWFGDNFMKGTCLSALGGCYY